MTVHLLGIDGMDRARIEELLELIVATGGHPKSQAAPGKAAKASKASKKG